MTPRLTKEKNHAKCLRIKKERRSGYLLVGPAKVCTKQTHHIQQLVQEVYGGGEEQKAMLGRNMREAGRQRRGKRKKGQDRQEKRDRKEEARGARGPLGELCPIADGGKAPGKR